jgi:hypothetical protein
MLSCQEDPHDAFHQVKLESQSINVLVVSARRCGEVVIDGENGLIIDPGRHQRYRPPVRQTFGQSSARCRSVRLFFASGSHQARSSIG